jgi:hypothetical protein
LTGDLDVNPDDDFAVELTSPAKLLLIQQAAHVGEYIKGEK